MNNESQLLLAALERIIGRLGHGAVGSDEQLRLALMGKPKTTDADGEEVARIFVLLVRAQEVCEQAVRRWQQSEHIAVASEVQITSRPKGKDTPANM